MKDCSSQRELALNGRFLGRMEPTHVGGYGISRMGTDLKYEYGVRVSDPQDVELQLKSTAPRRVVVQKQMGGSGKPRGAPSIARRDQWTLCAEQCSALRAFGIGE